MFLRSINPLHWILLGALAIGGCTTDKDRLLPLGQLTMLNIWDANASSATINLTDSQLLQARSTLHRALSEPPQDHPAYTRTAQNDIYSQFNASPIQTW